MNHRLYAFVANHYLSPLQCGLQTAHVVSELSQRYKVNTSEQQAFNEWAAKDKTIIICGAGNHQGVLDCYAELTRTGSAIGLPTALFREDEQSMNGMATACGVIVPQCYWDTRFVHAPDQQFEVYGAGAIPTKWVHAQVDHTGSVIAVHEYPLTHPEGQFVNHIKQYRLA